MAKIAKKTKAKSQPAKLVAAHARVVDNTAQTPRVHQKEVMHRLRRVEGQIRGVLVMMEQDQPCDAIAQQLSAARKALDRAFYEMMACSLEMEVIDQQNDVPLSERIATKAKLMAKYA